LERKMSEREGKREREKMRLKKNFKTLESHAA
jgi:hypothetical protein